MNCDKKVFLLAACVCGVLALTSGARGEPISTEVQVGPWPQPDVAVGFGEFEGPQVLVLNVRPRNGYELVDTKCTDAPGLYLCTRKVGASSLHQWEITGVLPNFVTIGGQNYQESHSSVFHGTVVKAAGGGKGSSPQPIPFDAKTCEVDLDGDTDNDSTTAHRPPSGSAAEDIAEYEQASEECTGMLLPVNDDNDVGWNKRDGDPSGENFDDEEDNELLALELKINTKHMGNFLLGSLGATIYDDAGHKSTSYSFLKLVGAGDGWYKDLYISGCDNLSSRASGHLGNVHVWFEAGMIENERKPGDNLRYLLVGTDIDVNSDNKSSGDPLTPIDDTNYWDAGEDFYENHGSQGHPNYQYGLLLVVNDDDDDGHNGPDNGWDGVDWDGDDGALVAQEDDDLCVLKVRALNLKQEHYSAIEDMDGTPLILVGKIGGTGGVRVFTTGENPQQFLLGVDNLWQDQLPDGTTLWNALKGVHDGLTLEVEGLKPGKVVMEVVFYINRAGGDLVLHRDRILITVTPASVHIYSEHNGPPLPIGSEVTPGSFVLINRDDDDGANGQDNSNAIIDGDSDKLDMARMRLKVFRPDLGGFTVELNAPEGDRAHVRVFNESGTPVTTWPDVIPLSRFASGPIFYHIEGLTAGSATFTLTVKQGETTVNTHDVKVTVKAYHGAFNAWGAWPGAQTTTSLNPTETITSANMGLSGNVKWAVDHGGTAAAIISHTPATGDKWHTVVVRYDTKSSDALFTKGVEIKAYDTGAYSKLAGVRRTVFKISYESVNVNGNLDLPDNGLRFDADMGSTTKAEVVTPGGAVTWFGAKVEIIGTISPSGIDWTNRGVSFVHGDPDPTKWQFLCMRENRYCHMLQDAVGAGSSFRRLDATDWWQDGDCHIEDTQYPTTPKPNRFFLIDGPGFLQSGFKQAQLRDDYRDFVNWSSNNSWTRCSPYANWWCELTGAYNTCTAVNPNLSGTGWNAGKIANTRPTVSAGTDQTVNKGAFVTLAATSTDADGNSSTDKDGDNDPLLDALLWVWTQTVEPGDPVVVLSNGGVGRTVSFTAPTIATVLTFQVTVQDGTQVLTLVKFRPTNHTSNPDSVQVTVNP